MTKLSRLYPYAITSPGYAEPIVPVPPSLLSKLEAWWDCEELGTATRVDDHSAHNLVTIGGGVTDNVGLNGNAIRFTVNDYAYTGTGWPTGDPSFSMCMHVHNFNLSGNAIFCQRGSTGTGSLNVTWHIYAATDGAVYFIMSSNGTMNSWLGSSVMLPAGTIVVGTTHFVYWSYNASTKEMGLSVDNGALQTFTSIQTPVTASREVLRFGHMTSSFPHDVNGWMDSINYYNEPLLSGERTWLWNNGLGRIYGDINP